MGSLYFIQYHIYSINGVSPSPVRHRNLTPAFTGSNPVTPARDYNENLYRKGVINISTKKKVTPKTGKIPIAEVRKENEGMKLKIEKLKEGGYCRICDKHKPKEQFYTSTDPLSTGGITPICKQCAKDIACRKDKNGDLHEPTRESLIKTLRYLDKPFLETVYDASIQEANKMKKDHMVSNFANAYFKNIAMPQYNGMTYAESDFLQEKIIYPDELSEDDMDVGTKEQYIRDKRDTIHLLHYDPFEQENISDQPFLYSQLLGMLDSSEGANEDMMRTSSAITIVRCFLQESKVDDAITKLMLDTAKMANNAGTIKSLQESKQKMVGVITSLAEANCLSLRYSRNSKKGENTWTGKLKRLKDTNIREVDINGFDIDTCKGMQQVANISMNAIVDKLHLEENDYADMLAEQRQKMADAEKRAEALDEATRLLLQENIKLRHTLETNDLLKENDLLDLNDVLDTYVTGNEKDGD